MRIEQSNILDVTSNDGNGIEIKGRTVVSGAASEKASDAFEKKTACIQATYENPKAEGSGTVSDVMAQASVMDAELMKNEMLVSGNTTTSKDGSGVEEEGFSLRDTDVKTIVTVTDKIKMQLAKAGVDVSCMGDGLSEEQIEAVTGNAALAAQIEGSLNQADLPATEDNITETIEAVEQAENIRELSDGAVKYMLDNELAPTIENLYKAEYSGSTGYTAPADNRIDYGALQGQIESVIAKAGLPVNAMTVELGHFMIQNDIAFTPENLSYMSELKAMEFPVNREEVLSAIMDAIAEGNRPKDAMLIAGYSMKDQAEHAVDVIEHATEADLKYVVSYGLELTVANLEAAGKQNAQAAVSEIEVSDTDFAFITAKRQLEETRLIMTAQANYALLKQGISIDTKPLEELVEELKNIENNYYANLLEQGGVPVTEDNVNLFAKTVDTVGELKIMPAYTLGIRNADISTLEGLHRAGSALENTLKKANESYETLMTAPRKDLGDSIQKAFRNVDDILEDLDLETSEANERAVRILAYNNLEITEESIAKMKAADAEVQRAFQNLSPAVVREMIKTGINPLDMNIQELNLKAEEIRNNLDEGGSERFSEYLWKLEQNHEISEADREAYIGIYRLLNQVEKTDGAVIGALIEQGAEVTMRNLLTNVRSMKHTNMDVKIDDSYGTTEELNSIGKSITDQIEKGYQTNCAKASLELLTPECMKTVMSEAGWEDLTPEQLLEQMRNAEVSEDESYIKEQQKDIDVCMTASEEVYQMLADYDMPNTVYNVMALQQYLNNRNSAFRQLFGTASDVKEEKNADLENAKEEVLKEYGEAVKTPEAMKEAQEKLAETAAHVMDTMLVEDANVTSMKIKEMKLMRTQIELSGIMAAKDETYAIPVLIQNQITSVHLRVVRGEAKKGLVNITFETDNLGKVAAEIKASAQGVTGYVASNKKETVSLLKQNKEALEDAVSTEGKAALDFVVSDTLDLNSFERKEAVKQEGEKELAKIQTTALYEIAKNFIEAVKSL